MKIELIEDIETFRGLRSDWDTLLERSSQFSVFLTWEWLFTWWTHFQARRKLFVLLVKDDATSQLLAIAPWFIQDLRRFPCLSLRKISFLGTGKVASDFLDLIISPGMEEPVLECLGAYLQTHARRWDVIEFKDVSEDSATLDPLRRMPPPRVRVLDRATEVCPYIPLPAESSLYLATLNSRFRKQLRSDARAVEVKHRMRYRLATVPEQLAQDIDRMFELQNERFRATSPNSAASNNFSGQPVRDFHGDVAAHMLPQGRLKLLFLEHHQKPIEFLYAFKYKNRVFTYQAGFDSDWQKLSPVNVLDLYAIEDCIRAGFTEYHFLRGGSAHKNKWTKVAIVLHTVLWINSNAKGSMYAMYLGLKTALQTVLIRFGFRGAPSDNSFGKPLPLPPSNA